jgi:hypothetical protein
MNNGIGVRVVCLSHSEMFLRVQYSHIGKYVWTSPDKTTQSGGLLLDASEWKMAFKCTLAFRGASCDANRHLVVAEVAEEISEKPNNTGFQ